VESTWTGLDDFLAGFYQKSWNTVAEHVINFVKQVWIIQKIL